MKDAKGHGSNKRGTHAGGIAQLPKGWAGVGYHGTASQFEEFKPNTPETPIGKDLTGVYFSGDARSAWGYANRASRREGAGKQSVIAAHLTMSNPLDITNLIKNGQRRGLSFGDAKRAAMAKVTPLHDGVIFQGNSMNPPEYIVFSGSQAKRLK